MQQKTILIAIYVAVTIMLLTMQDNQFCVTVFLPLRTDFCQFSCKKTVTQIDYSVWTFLGLGQGLYYLAISFYWGIVLGACGQAT